MSIKINDLTVTFQNRLTKNKVTAIDHANAGQDLSRRC